MVEFKVVLAASNESRYEKFRAALDFSLAGWIEGKWEIVRYAYATGEEFPEGAQLIFVDAREEGIDALLEKLGERTSRPETQSSSLFLVVEEEDSGSSAFAVQCLNSGLVDDVAVFPFRPIEILGKLRHYHQNLMWEEVSTLSDSYGKTVAKLGGDLELAERIHRAKLPTKFPKVKGAKVAFKYLAGMKSGGEYFDLADSADGQQMSLIFSDASSYGLSSAFLKLLVTVTAKLGGEGGRVSVAETYNRIRGEVALCMGEQDQLSLFYGRVSRRDYVLTYLNFGSAKLFYAPAGKPFTEVSHADHVITAKGEGEGPTPVENRLQLEAGSRLLLLSDGFWERVNGLSPEWWEKGRGLDAEAFTTELSFLSKKDLEAEDDMPVQDCTAVVLDVDARLMRLAG